MTIRRPIRCGHASVLLGLLAVGVVLAWIARTLVRDIRAGIT